jgi:hypothetical protein
MISQTLLDVAARNSIVVAFLFVGLVVWLSYWLSRSLTGGRLHGSAIAIALGLCIAYAGGALTGGSHGIADIPWLAGVGIMGGAMFRDFAIVATAFGADVEAIKKSGFIGATSVLLGVVLSFIVGAVVAVLFGYTDPAEITTIGAGAATYIVGPVTGTALGVGSDIIALSIAPGDDRHPHCCAANWIDQPAFSHGLWRFDGHHQWCSGRPCGSRPGTGALRGHDRDFLHRRRVPACSLGAVFYNPGYRRLSGND